METAPPEKGTAPPQFSAHVYCGQTAGWIKMPLGIEVSLGPFHIVLDGDNTAPLPKKWAEPPQAAPAHLCCSQIARCIKMPLGMEVGPQPRRLCVQCGRSYPQDTPTPPNFGPCLLWPNGWVDEDAAWYGSRPRPRPHYTRQGPSSRERGTAASRS